ncbi:MAG: hypothetical protein JXB30_14620 [Anaerolineae bacterium]|nr:hypothetical protein [Anaerolineae bacterium]
MRKISFWILLVVMLLTACSKLISASTPTLPTSSAVKATDKGSFVSSIETEEASQAAQEVDITPTVADTVIAQTTEELAAPTQAQDANDASVSNNTGAMATPTTTPQSTSQDSGSGTAVECSVYPARSFATIWRGDASLQASLGCPTSHHPRVTPDAWEIMTAYQAFERGAIIWSDHVGWHEQLIIYVLYSNSTYEHFDDTFDPAVGTAGSSETPPSGLLEPTMGFGKVWQDHANVRDALGWATAPETSGIGRFQMFDGGNMVWISPTNQTYVFISGTVSVLNIPFSE